MGIIALIFLILTAGLLVADLKQPKRFLYVLLRPQWHSWLVRGAYLLTGYGALLTLWLAAHLAGARALSAGLMWPTALLAVGAAVYTAFLFAQAKGRDFWQNPLLPIHMLVHALLAGTAVWLAVDAVSGSDISTARVATIVALIVSLVTLSAEILTTPPTADAQRALKWIIADRMGAFPIWVLGVGHIGPLVVLFLCQDNDIGRVCLAVTGALILWGLHCLEYLWVTAPQRLPLS